VLAHPTTSTDGRNSNEVDTTHLVTGLFVNPFVSEHLAEQSGASLGIDRFVSSVVGFFHVMPPFLATNARAHSRRAAAWIAALCYHIN